MLTCLNMTCLKISLIKQVINLYTESYTTLLREINENGEINIMFMVWQTQYF